MGRFYRVAGDFDNHRALNAFLAMWYIIGYAMFCSLLLIVWNAFKHPRIYDDEKWEHIRRFMEKNNMKIEKCHDCPYWDYCKERLGGERHRDCPAPHLTQRPKPKAKVVTDD